MTETGKNNVSFDMAFTDKDTKTNMHYYIEWLMLLLWY